ncbi:MAG TPA: AAA family ATPase [Solirubrobacterales bacterium]
MPKESRQEQRVWSLLVEDFRHDRIEELGVKEKGPAKRGSKPPKFQIFEVMTAAIFAELCPEYDWYVTPNQSDGGLDFWGSKSFLKEPTLGIDAVVSVAGQCKKRGKVEEVVRLVGGDLLLMEYHLRPTFFFFAISSRLTKKRVDKARKVLQRGHKQCHVLDRGQLEGLMHSHPEPVDRVLRASHLERSEVDEVLSYLSASRERQLADAVTISVHRKPLAGEPIQVAIDVQLPLAWAAGLRLGWRPAASGGADREVVLIDPIGADTEQGAALALSEAEGDPTRLRRSLELLTYAVGEVDLGEVSIGEKLDDGSAHETSLGRVLVHENMRPRFFAPPFRGVLTQLEDEYKRASGSGVRTIGVVGAGGSGKSRVCEEFALRKRRQGCATVIARQAKTVDAPHRLLADLFEKLVAEEFDHDDQVGSVTTAIAAYDASTAEKVEGSLRTIFEASDARGDGIAEQSVISALMVLLVARADASPQIVHLQDLHWCDVDTLMLLEKLVWRLDAAYSSEAATRSNRKGILVIFEGRVKEKGAPGEEDWSSGHFEAFLRKNDGPTAVCSAFDPADGLEFVRLLFADSRRGKHTSGDLLGLQEELVERIFRAAGGNPFHSLEQVKFLKESGVIGQNERTGFLYLIKPEIGTERPPAEISALIRMRWEYLRERRPELALLIWGAALLEDRLPTPLFLELREELAPDLSFTEVDATDILLTGYGQLPEVAFRHEHYFRSIRDFDVPAEERERVVTVYSDWLSGRRNPADRFRRARALLKLPNPDVTQLQRLLESALAAARKRGDQALARRIAATALDVTWERDVEYPMKADTFLRRADQDLNLTRELLTSDRAQAGNRLQAMTGRLDSRLNRFPQKSVEIQRRRLAADVLSSQLLYNNSRPAQAARVAGSVVSAIRALRLDGSSEDGGGWEALELEALFSEFSALALSGEVDPSLEVADRAVAIARRRPSEMSWRVISTYANILLARDPAVAESTLRELRDNLPETEVESEPRHAIELNLGMALLLKAYDMRARGENETDAVLAEARDLLAGVFKSAYRVGQYPRAGAAAMMRGILGAFDRDGEDLYWFGQAVAAASRGHKSETLWRAHINFATAIYQSEGEVTEEVRNQARAALEILEGTLATYAEPDTSPRFALVRSPLAQAVCYLVAVGDEAGHEALVRFPALRESFENVEAGDLRDDRGATEPNHEWLRIGDEDYVIY